MQQAYAAPCLPIIMAVLHCKPTQSLQHLIMVANLLAGRSSSDVAAKAFMSDSPAGKQWSMGPLLLKCCFYVFCTLGPYYASTALPSSWQSCIQGSWDTYRHAA